MAAARRLRARLSRWRRLPQRRPQGQAGCHASGRLDLRRDRRPHLLFHARADARCAVRRPCAGGGTMERPARASSWTCAPRSPQPVIGFSDDPQLGPAQQHPVREAMMGDIIRPGSVPMRLAVEIIGTAPVERLDVLYGTQLAQTVRPYTAADLGRRVRVLWQGAEYRGRGRETNWRGQLTLTGNRIARFAAVNFLNPERQVREIKPGTALAWTSVTTGNLAGIDLWLDDAARRRAGPGDQYRFGSRGSRRARRRYHYLRGRRPRPQAQRLSPSRGRLEQAGSCASTPSTTAAPRICRSMSASPRPMATKPGRARSTSLHDLITRFCRAAIGQSERTL